MIHLLTYYGLANCLTLAMALGLGYWAKSQFIVHFAFGFLGALSAILWIGVAMFYLIYSGQAVKRAAAAGLAAEADDHFCRDTKKNLFPWFVISILLLIVTPFLGAIAQNGGAASGHHLAAWLATLVYWLAVYLSYDKVSRHGKLIEDIVAKAQAARQARGRQAPRQG